MPELLPSLTLAELQHIRYDVESCGGYVVPSSAHAERYARFIELGLYEPDGTEALRVTALGRRLAGVQ